VRQLAYVLPLLAVSLFIRSRNECALDAYLHALDAVHAYRDVRLIKTGIIKCKYTYGSNVRIGLS
jgi:hypothetical protein